jgi:hypothetical protein
LRQLAVVLTALEPIYYPKVREVLNLGWDEEYARYDKWRRRLPLTSTTRWLGIDPKWLRDAAAGLLQRADWFDPLGGWLDVVREADPERWSKLKGDARLAIDFRIAAEILLRHYEDLVRGRRARALPVRKGRLRGEFDTRLKRQGSLDATLMNFGLSPHPRLVLVLEGDTEMHVFPRVMERFGVRTDRDFIAIENAEGVDRDLGPLLAYAVAPRTEREADDRYLRLLRPLTRILVVTDAEGAMSSAADREQRREIWLERILRTLPPRDRTDGVREALTHLVHVETWDRGGQSFEFATLHRPGTRHGNPCAGPTRTPTDAARSARAHRPSPDDARKPRDRLGSDLESDPGGTLVARARSKDLEGGSTRNRDTNSDRACPRPSHRLSARVPPTEHGDPADARRLEGRVLGFESRAARHLCDVRTLAPVFGAGVRSLSFPVANRV